MVIKPKQTQSTRRYISFDQCKKMLSSDSGCEPLTPDDIAEVVVFNAARRENVVVADTLIFPNHQVDSSPSFLLQYYFANTANIY